MKNIEMRRLEVHYSPCGLRELADTLEALGADWKPTYSTFDGQCITVEVTKHKAVHAD